MGEAAASSPQAEFRTIGQLASRCGAYCWLEDRLFSLTGAWASATLGDTETADPQASVAFSVMSAHHGLVAARWRDRLPVRAGVDAGALIAPPTPRLAEALDRLGGEPRLAVRVHALAELVLPSVLAAYEQHLSHSTPVNEGPVRAVLAETVALGARELERLRALRSPVSPGVSTDELGDAGALERILAEDFAPFPDWGS
jgi:hypothetical protein